METSKRKFADFKTDASGHGEDGPSQYVPGAHAPKRQKKKPVKRALARPDNLNWLKKRTRTIERKLRTGAKIPANIKNDLEREIAHHKQKIAEVEDEKKLKSIITKYHMVRFFERKKADRLAKQIEKQISESTDPTETEQLKADLHVAQIDSTYAKFFPFRERYISLYPVASSGAKGGDKKEDASSAAKSLKAERPPIWGEIEEASRKGLRALIEIRERKTGGENSLKSAKVPASKQSSAANADTGSRSRPLQPGGSVPGTGRKQPSKGKAQAEVEPAGLPDAGNDSDSDGGFFE